MYVGVYVQMCTKTFTIYRWKFNVNYYYYKIYRNRSVKFVWSVQFGVIVGVSFEQRTEIHILN